MSNDIIWKVTVCLVMCGVSWFWGFIIGYYYNDIEGFNEHDDCPGVKEQDE